MGLFGLFLPEWILTIFVVRGICPLYFSCQIYCYKAVHNIPMIFLISVECIVIFTSLIPVIANLYLFSVCLLICLARGLYVFSKNQLSFSLIFFYVVFSFFSLLVFTLLIIISFLLLTLGFMSLYFCSFLGWRLRSLSWDISFQHRRSVL